MAPYPPLIVVIVTSSHLLTLRVTSDDEQNRAEV
jgi:hypothetical protein